MDAAISFNINNPSDSDFTRLGVPIPDYNANNMVTQTNFTIQVQAILLHMWYLCVWPSSFSLHKKATLPSTTGRAVIRVRYVSNNPDEAVKNNPQAIFYQYVLISKTFLMGPHLDYLGAQIFKLNDLFSPPVWTQPIKWGLWMNCRSIAFFFFFAGHCYTLSGVSHPKFAILFTPWSPTLFKLLFYFVPFHPIFCFRKEVGLSDARSHNQRSKSLRPSSTSKEIISTNYYLIRLEW